MVSHGNVQETTMEEPLVLEFWLGRCFVALLTRLGLGCPEVRVSPGEKEPLPIDLHRA